MESEEVRLVTSELLDLVNKADMVKKNVTSVSSSKKKREEEIRKQVEAAGQSGEVEEVLKKFWPEATFKQTELIKEDYQSQLNGKVEKLAIVVDKEKPIEDSHLPQLREAIKTAKRGQVFITKTQAAIDGDEDEPTTTSSSTLLTVIVDSDKENWFKDLQRGLKTTEKMSCNNFTTSSVKVAKTLRKMLELEAVKSNRKYKIFCLPRSTVKIEGPQHQTSEIWPTIKNTKKAPSLIIKTGEGQSFADTLKKVKETVTNTHGVTVKNIENKNGDVKINLRTFNKEKVENFRKEIEHQVGARTEKLELMKTLIIRDLDESTEPVEILRAIQNETNYTLKEQIRLSKNVNQRSGMKYATTRVPDNIAKLLIAKRKIRVGLGLICRVEEYSIPVKCFRCFKFGHLGKDCQAESEPLKGCCYRCGEKGHIAKVCTKTAKCYECKVEGHRADSMMCPIYRSLAQKIRNEKRGSVKRVQTTINGSH